MNNFDMPSAQVSSEDVSNENDIFAKADEIERLIMEDTSQKEEEKNVYYSMFRDYFLENGAKEYIEWGVKLGEISKAETGILVRRESPDKVANMVKKHESLSIKFSTYGVQPNAAVLGDDLSGLRIALAGGFGKVGKGSVVFTLGFKSSPSMQITNLPNGEYLQFQGKERMLTKMIAGEVPFENIRFILMRMPKSFFPEKYLTESESEREDTKHIQRMYVFE
ncbi:MAG: hypothetical protein PHP62_03315 [Candidatus Moranbacteria bacterium]|nr:hypothetical protein [Candidatus Moranbacteria bacterium]